jgi:hypothetical protein
MASAGLHGLPRASLELRPPRVSISNPSPPFTLFFLSPAFLGGERAALLFRPEADFALARQLRSLEGAALGDLFSFLSGLYFRGKVAYAQAFGRPPRACQRRW